MQELEIEYDGFNLYNAGSGYSQNFSRDSILSAILAEDSDMLRNQLSFCAVKQGLDKNPYSGEEPGKIFHEFPEVNINGLSTGFAACDTTALYLIGHEVYQKSEGDKSLAEEHKESIERAVGYIISHLDNNLFTESPEFCGAGKFALKVTYWKDSGILDRENEEPMYPIVYTLAHVQNMCGLRCAARILGSGSLKKTAAKMSKALQKLYDKESELFYIAIDKQGPVRGINSDFLNALFYLEPGDLPEEQLEGIVKSSAVLETSIGYRTLDSALSSLVVDEYHGSKTVWPVEQAIIYSAARRFGLDHVQEVTSRIVPLLDTDPEFFVLEGDGITKGGCDPQLWTWAARNTLQQMSDVK
ncbi:MAG: hypothetical protein U9P44_04165 [archaeon]|nr:hypothetical protein [archaeon]